MARILVVDDDLSILKMYELLFKIYGHVIVGTAKNGEEAVEKYVSINPNPDIVIMDHRMPIKNGLDASKEIIDYDKNAMIIFASADDTIYNQAKKIGIFAFEIKPFDSSQLIKNIEKAIEIKNVESIHNLS